MESETRNPFISVEYLRRNTIISDNVDAKVLLSIIKMAESKYIKLSIGTSLYDKLHTDVMNNSVSGVYKQLLDDYILPTLTQYSVYEAIPYGNFKFNNKSISKQESDTSTAVDLTELTYLRDNVLNTAEFYAQELIRYLQINNVSEYFTFVNGGVNPQPNAYFSGYHIPRKGRNGFYDLGGPNRDIKIV